jgi:hypothetical protein
VSVYRVTGATAYHGNKPGTTFEAVFPPNVERRALRRGALQLIERSTPQIQPGSYQLPAGWHTTTSIEEGSTP